MTIFGRSPNLWLGAVLSIFNVAVVYQVGGFNPTIEQIGVTNIALGAIIALIANSDSVAKAVVAANAARKTNGHN